ncbi:acyltransferase family protein [Devosia sp. SL43]|uniref:acyltransferase family protein n=1 Tax=Devosia sp. SL43 TaxID=2806348 RepID=UPI001F4132C5|nr:acyltransferase [Devosia sp. SL43]UJW85678.1 acyltransferase [Devosia sp. SL43]
MSQQDNRLLGADFVRASACIIVLFHHLAQRVDYQSELGANALIRVFNSIGGFGVGMFFVLSGFLLARPFWQALDGGEPLPSLRTYAIRRAARIVPGFWLALTVTFVLSIAVFGAVADGWLWLRYASGLLLVSDWHWTTLFPVEINGPLWSIGFEVSSYLMLPLGFWALFAIGRGRVTGWPARLLWLVVIAAALGAHWLFYSSVTVDPLRKGWNYGLQGGAKTWMPWFNPFGFFVMFATGALAAGAQVLLARFRNVIFDILALAALVWTGTIIRRHGMEGGGEFYGWLRVPYQFPLFHLLVGLVLATTPSSVILGRLLDNRVVAYLAQISFGVYVWHFLVLDLVRKYWVPEMDHATMTDPTKFLIASGVITAITMAIAALSYRWMEAPVIGWARQFEKRRVEATTMPATA